MSMQALVVLWTLQCHWGLLHLCVLLLLLWQNGDYRQLCSTLYDLDLCIYTNWCCVSNTFRSLTQKLD